MKASNQSTQALRHSETGQLWEEVLTNDTGTIEVKRFATFRVRAAGATTVTIGGVLAMTMADEEIAIFNAGIGDTTDAKSMVTVVIADAAAYVQVAKDTIASRP